MLKRYKILTLKKIHPPVWQMRRVKIVKRVGLTIVVLLLPMPCRLALVRADQVLLNLKDEDHLQPPCEELEESEQRSLSSTRARARRRGTMVTAPSPTWEATLTFN